MTEREAERMRSEKEAEERRNKAAACRIIKQRLNIYENQLNNVRGAKLFKASDNIGSNSVAAKELGYHVISGSESYMGYELKGDSYSTTSSYTVSGNGSGGYNVSENSNSHAYYTWDPVRRFVSDSRYVKLVKEDKAQRANEIEKNFIEKQHDYIDAKYGNRTNAGAKDYLPRFLLQLLTSILFIVGLIAPFIFLGSNTDANAFLKILSILPEKIKNLSIWWIPLVWIVTGIAVAILKYNGDKLANLWEKNIHNLWFHALAMLIPILSWFLAMFISGVLAGKHINPSLMYDIVYISSMCITFAVGVYSMVYDIVKLGPTKKNMQKQKNIVDKRNEYRASDEYVQLEKEISELLTYEYEYDYSEFQS